MQINVTKKLAKAMKIKPSSLENEINPLFVWTANWIDFREGGLDEMLVLVNNATRFVVGVYPLKKSELQNAEELILDAIEETLLSFNVNPENIEEYLRIGGELQFGQNRNRTATAWVNWAGRDSAYYLGQVLRKVEEAPRNTGTRDINFRRVSAPDNKEKEIYPYQEMTKALSELTGKKPLDYRAFELLITLDLEIYQAERRLIVPASIELFRLHETIQWVFDWQRRHLYDFTLRDKNNPFPLIRLVPYADDLEYDEEAVLLAGRKLDEFFPEHQFMVYTYDMYDDWQHRIELVQVIEGHDQESPYLLHASGQGPPEDIGGVPGFLQFRKIYLDPEHPQHELSKQWARFWTPELSDWRKTPKVIQV